jgi:hypothetical protein
MHQPARRLTACLSILAVVACTAATPASPTPLPGSPTASAAASAVPTPSPGPSSSPVPGIAGRDWEAFPIFLDGSPLLKGLTGVVAGGSGFIAWGATATGSLVMASSAQLSGWGQAGSPGQFDGETVEAMSAGPGGTLAIGLDANGATHAWRSADGLAWTAVAGLTGIGGRVDDLATFRAGYVAVGSGTDRCGLVAWLSPDGATWRASAPFPGAAGTCTTATADSSGPIVFSVRAGPGGLVAFGTVRGTGDAFWTSTDGISWAIHPQPSLGGNVGGFTVGGPGYVAVGATGAPSSAVVWTSPDGATWTRVADQAAFLDADMADVRTLADGTLVAVGTAFGSLNAIDRFAAWTSADGLTWQRTPSAVNSNDPGPYTDDFNVTVRALATDGRWLVAIGTGTNGIWVSPRVTPGLRAATLHVALSGRVDRPLGTVSGTCRSAEDGSPDTQILATVGTADGKRYALQLQATIDGRITTFLVYGDPLVQVDAAASGQLDAAHLTVTPGSTGGKGEVRFRGLTDTSSPGSAPLSGLLDWSCGS